jgi:simple sugar transport system ATP-binding protein
VSDSPLLQIRGLTKRFPGVTALGGVDFSVRAGEIHALLGENGAGKSTLIKVLTGVYPDDGGEIKLAGKTIRPGSPKQAERAGISTVYQEVNLVPSLTVAENITLGRQPGKFGFLNWREIRQRARTALARLEVDCDVDAELGSLSVAMQQMVAIARALDMESRLLILDEPTASLDEHEVAELFGIMRKLREQGMGIIFVTHFLDQVYSVTDRLTILRNGQLVGEYPTQSLNRLELVGKMLGREISEKEFAGGGAEVVADKGTPPVLEARGLSRRGALTSADVSIRAGEVVGLGGLLGSGRTETARLLFGIDAADTGDFKMKGQPVKLTSPRDAIRLGLAFCSEDRKVEGILPNMSLRENLILALQGKRGLLRALTNEEQNTLCDHYIKALRIKTASQETLIRNLSGGNQQKVLLARWLATQPQVIILDEPTRGIDVGAKQEIEQLVAKLRADGLAVVFISSEIEEVIRTCSRVLVMRERRMTGEVSGASLNLEGLMRLMAGTHEK